MNRISKAFERGRAFIPFIVGGDPDIETTEKLLYTLRDAGADAIEIGIPFSDPVAEGPVIEAAAERALIKGCTADDLFDLVSRVRDNIEIPILFMTYYNPVFAYGIERFIARSVGSGLDGLIVPDLPYEERAELYDPCKAAGLELISIIAPTTGEHIPEIAKNSGGFLYCVSSMGVTGMRSTLGDSAKQMIAQAKAVTQIPCAVGFGISTAEQASEVAQFADGVIVGSALVQIIGEHGRDCIEPIYQFAKEIRQCVR